MVLACLAYRRRKECDVHKRGRMVRSVDYKNVRCAEIQDRRPPQSNRIRFFLLGVISGVAVSAVTVVIYFNYAYQPRSNEAAAARTSQPPPMQKSDVSEGDFYPYDFFDILKNGIVLPESEVESGAVRPAYLLQLGSFHTRHKAEVFQREIKTIGFDSKVAVSGENDNVWYIVTIGPDYSLSRINNIKLKLRAEGIEPLIIKR